MSLIHTKGKEATMLIARIIVPVAVSWLFMGSSVVADNRHSDHHLDAKITKVDIPQEPHVHGAATLFIIHDGVQLDIELLSPAVNLLGFEGSAINHAQKTKIESVRQTMLQSHQLFQIESANCKLISHSVNFDSDAEGHNDFEAHYQFRCDNHDQLSSLNTSILNAFSGIHSLQVQWIVNDRQGSTLLDNGQSHVIFR